MLGVDLETTALGSSEGPQRNRRLRIPYERSAAQNLVPANSSVVLYDLGGGRLDVAPLRNTSDRFELVGEPLGRPDIGGLDVVEAKERLSVEMSVDIAIPLAAEGTAARLLTRFTIRAAPSRHTAAAVNVAPRLTPSTYPNSPPQLAESAS